MAERIASNTASAIAELRKEMQKHKGIAKRAHASAAELRSKAYNSDSIVAAARRAIREMGGKVR